MIGGPRKSYSDVILRLGAGLTERANTGTVGPSETSDARRAAFGLFCVVRRLRPLLNVVRCPSVPPSLRRKALYSLYSL